MSLESGAVMFHKVTCVVLALSAGTSPVGRAAAQQTRPPGEPAHMQHRFDDPVKFAASFDDPARDAWQMPARVIETLGLKPGMRVADIGAGTGYFSTRLAKVSPDLTVYAADIEPAMVDYLKKRAASEQLKNVVPVLAGAASPNLPGPVDVVLVVDTYHHIASRVDYFKALKKSLERSGRIAIVDFRKDSPEGPPPEFRFTAEQIGDEMRQAGFVLDTKHDFLPRQHFLVFRAQ